MLENAVKRSEFGLGTPENSAIQKLFIIIIIIIITFWKACTEFDQGEILGQVQSLACNIWSSVYVGVVFSHAHLSAFESKVTGMIHLLLCTGHQLPGIMCKLL